MFTTSLLRFSASLIVLACATPLLSADTLRVPKDFATIQAAIDAAEEGDEVIVSAGTYTETVELTDARDVTLRGQGKVTLLPTDESSNNMNIDGCVDVVIDNLWLRDGQAGVDVDTSVGVVLKRLRIRDVDSDGLRLFGTVSCLVSRVTVKNADRALLVGAATRSVVDRVMAKGVADGIICIQAPRTIVQNCRLNGVAGEGISLGGGMEDSLIRGCVVSGFETGIEASGDGDSVQVIGNRISKCITGMRIGSDGDESLIQVVGNRVNQVVGVGVVVDTPLLNFVKNRVSAAIVGVDILNGADSTFLASNRIQSGTVAAVRMESAVNVFANNNLDEGAVLDGQGNAAFLGDAVANDGELLRVPQDFDTIQEAIEAAESGDTVLISAGVYAEPINIENVSDLTLRGKGKVVLTNPFGTAIKMDESSRVRFERLRFTDATRGIDIEESSQVEIVNCRFEQIPVIGIDVFDGAQILVERCRFDENQAGYISRESERELLLRNRMVGTLNLAEGESESTAVRFNDNEQSLLLDSRLQKSLRGVIAAGQQMLVANSRFSDCFGGIVLASEGGLAFANRVTGGSEGIALSDGDESDGKLVANRVAKTQDRGLVPRISDSMVVGNWVKGNLGHGIQFGLSFNHLIASNSFLANGLDGMETQAAEQSTFTANICRKNKGLDVRAIEEGDNRFVDNTAAVTNLEL